MVVYQLLLDVVWHSRQRVVGTCATGSLIVWVECWSMLEQHDGTGESGDWFRCLRETAAACQRHWLHVPQAPWDCVFQFRDSYCFNWYLDIWISTSRLIFFHLIFTHLYWASVMLGLKGRPFTDLPVRILREIGRFGNIFWFAKFLFYLVETTYFPSGSRSSMWDVSPKSEGGCLSSGPKPPWYASIIGSKRGAKTK